MVSEIFKWEVVGMVIVMVLTIHGGIKLINRMFEPNNKKKNSLF